MTPKKLQTGMIIASKIRLTGICLTKNIHNAAVATTYEKSQLGQIIAQYY